MLCEKNGRVSGSATQILTTMIIITKTADSRVEKS